MRHRNALSSISSNENHANNKFNYGDTTIKKHPIIPDENSLPHHDYAAFSSSMKRHNNTWMKRKKVSICLFVVILLGWWIIRWISSDVGNSSVFEVVEYLPLESLMTSSSSAAADMDETVFDVIVVGSGPAGLSAALFATRAGWSVLVVGSIDGGMLSQAIWLENFPSFNNLANDHANWLKQTQSQIYQMGSHLAPPGLAITRIDASTTVFKKIINKGDIGSHQQIYFYLQTNHENVILKSKSVILAMGSTANRLNLPNEKQLLWGRYIHTCVICDGSNYNMKNIMVVGGGDAAMEAAVYLLQHKFAQQVQLVHRQTKFQRITNPSHLHFLQSHPNVHFHTPHIIQEWIISQEDDKHDQKGEIKDPQKIIFQGAQLRHVISKTTKNIKCDAVFVMIGSTPNTSWLPKDLQLPKNGAMSTSTSLAGVFAAGDIVDSNYRQAITASASGAQAAMEADRYLQLNYPQVSASPKKLSQPQHFENKKKSPQWKDTKNKQQASSGDNISCDLVKSECIQEVIQKFPVVVFSKSWCPYCRRAFNVLSLEGVNNLKVIDLTNRENAHAIQSTLESLTSRRTVPNVFVGGISIGGGDETVALHQENKLRTILEQAKAI